MNKISYKTYLNDRLNQVDFHGLSTYPLYVQVTFDRKTLFFKSYYFELFSKPWYTVTIPDGSTQGPALKQIIEKENEVIRFVIEKLNDGFSLEAFKRLYAYFSRDICEATEVSFVTYLYLFFAEKNLPHMSKLIKWGTIHLVAYDLVMDLKKIVKEPLYDELIKQSYFQAPPYLQLFSFMRNTKNKPMFCLTAMEWDNIETIKAFKEFIESAYPKMNSTELIGQVNNWAKY